MSQIPEQRRLWVAWRHPSGSIHPIGQLVLDPADDTARYRFTYLKRAELLPEFRPLPGFPDLHAAYVDDELFPVFANRLMSRSRPDYEEYLHRLHLPVQADPFEVLGRSTGRRMTDRIEVFPDVERLEGRATTVFFGRGVRHLPGAAEALADLHVGDELVLRRDPGNPYNSRALLLVGGDVPVAYVPDYLVEIVHQLCDLNEGEPTILVEHVNGPEVAPHLRLLCRLDAPWPTGWEPFSEAEFAALAEPA